MIRVACAASGWSSTLRTCGGGDCEKALSVRASRVVSTPAGTRQRNEFLMRYLGELEGQVVLTTTDPRLVSVGFTTEMDQYMAAANLLVGKAGGLTTSEALARHLPMTLIEPIPGQEFRNVMAPP